MNRMIITIAIALLSMAHSALFAQAGASKIGIGLNVGGQRIFGDRPEELFGVGGEGVISYRILPFADLALALGYSQLKYNFVPGTGTSTTDLINADLKANLEIMSSGLFRPFVTLGLGIANYKMRSSTSGRVNDGVFFGGGGFRLFMNPIFDLYASADYRFTTGDTFDSNTKEGTANDGYLSIRTGMTYYLGGGRRKEPQVIADERAPFIELQEDPYAEDSYSQEDPYSPNETRPSSSRETKNMEEYVRLKSRVDQLVGNVDSREKEITDLNRELRNRKGQLSTLQNEATRKPPRQIRSRSSMSGFADIYQEALTNLYNKSYSEAISLFRLLLQQYAHHSLAGNCQFWIGKSYYAMNRYTEAVDEFYKVLSFERSLKKDDALFYLGRAYLKLGSGDQARETFTRLMRDYPTSEFVEQARTHMTRP
ncbi:MAG: tetratricopeptide repeat protein [bacterium]